MTAQVEEVVDGFHLAVAERVAASDRAFKAEHPDADFVIRPATPHEMCRPNQPCTVVGWVRVIFVSDGVRRREAWDWGLAQ
jgi:hypothetical protein